MKSVYHFHIIRFMPFAQTGEFANIGVLMYSPKTGFFDYKLAPSRFRRVTEFFKEMDKTLYPYANERITLELDRIKDFRPDRLTLNYFIKELIRPRDGLLQFSTERSIYTDAPEQALEKEFALNVGRSFATREHVEQKMTTELRAILNNKVLGGVKYKTEKLEAGYLEFELPLVATVGVNKKVIKPLAFNQATALAANDHANTWIGRIKKLIQSKALKGNDILFALKPPISNNDALSDVYDDTLREIHRLSVHTSTYTDKEAILEFAKFNIDDQDSFCLS